MKLRRVMHHRFQKAGEEQQTISPEEQIGNVIQALAETVFGDAHQGRQDAIKSTTLQLRSMWNKYQRGDLEPIKDEQPPS